MSNLSTEHEIEIDRIHDAQLAAKDAEIERLQHENRLLRSQLEVLKAMR
jgi:hypothetical protein